jgi:hypothetical protein
VHPTPSIHNKTAPLRPDMKAEIVRGCDKTTFTVFKTADPNDNNNMAWDNPPND